MFKTDAPITKPEDDLLGRQPFAKNLALAVLSYKESQSIAIGLYGAWGDGKTSLLNLVLSEVAKNTSEESEHKPPIVLRFNPWNFSTQEQLIAQFFKQLSLKLKMSNLSDSLKGVSDKLDMLSKVLIPAKLIPGIKDITEFVQDTIQKAGEATRAAGEAIDKDVEGMKNAIDEVLSKLDRKIIITIDDIDRLTDGEIRQVFQLVKSLGDFKNTVYFLLFDRDVVAKALDTSQNGNGLRYLEKIIQVPFELPAPSERQVLDLVLKRMTTVIQNVDESKWNGQYWGNILQSGFKYHFKNLRSADRFLSVFTFNFGLMESELNPIDLAAMAGLQVFQPKLYSAIKQNHTLFLGKRITLSKADKRQKLKSECDEIFKLATGPFAEHAVDHVKKIFPQLEEYYDNTTYDSSGSRWRRDSRVCSESHFDKYFNLNIPQDDIPKSDIEQLVAASGSETQFRSMLLEFGKNGLFQKALDRLQDYTEEDIAESNIPNVIKVILDEGDQFLERHRNSFFSTSFDVSILIYRLCSQLLKRFNTHEKRMKVFYNAAKSATKSVYTISQQVTAMAQEHGKYGSNKELLELCTVKQDDLVKLEKLSAIKIKKLSTNDKFWNHPKLAALLHIWRSLGKTSDCDKFVKSKIKDEEKFIKLLRAFTNKGYQTGISDYASVEYYLADPKSLENWISPTMLKKRLSVIMKRDDYETIDGDTKKSIDKYYENLST